MHQMLSIDPFVCKLDSLERNRGLFKALLLQTDFFVGVGEGAGDAFGILFVEPRYI